MANDAVRQIDEIHQAERDGEPARQHEQQHAVGDAVEQNGQHDRPMPNSVTTPCGPHAGEALAGSTAGSTRCIGSSGNEFGTRGALALRRCVPSQCRGAFFGIAALPDP